MKKITYLLIGCITALTFTGCGEKIIEVPTYIYNEAPVLEEKKQSKTYQFGKLYNRNGKVCVKKWEGCAEFSQEENRCVRTYSNCIPKQDFLSLVEYLQDMGATIERGNTQVQTYNKWAAEQNEKAANSKKVDKK